MNYFVNSSFSQKIFLQNKKNVFNNLQLKIKHIYPSRCWGHQDYYLSLVSPSSRMRGMKRFFLLQNINPQSDLELSSIKTLQEMVLGIYFKSGSQIWRLVSPNIGMRVLSLPHSTLSERTKFRRARGGEERDEEFGYWKLP